MKKGAHPELLITWWMLFDEFLMEDDLRDAQARAEATAREAHAKKTKPKGETD